MERRGTVEEKDADRAVVRALRSAGGTATRADLVLATALPEMVVERALERLLDRYESSVAVRKGGVLVYRFHPAFRVRRERQVALRAFLDAVRRTARACWRAVVLGFRMVLAVQLLVYLTIVLLPISVVLGTIAGVVLAIAIIFYAPDALEILTVPWAWVVFLGICVIIGIGWIIKKKYDLILALVGGSGGGKHTGITGLVERVNQFALGPTASPPRPNPKRDERIVLGRIRAHDGRLRAVDLIDWLGLSFERADQQATRIAVEYGGEPTASDADGDVEVLEFHFKSLLPSAGDAGDLADAKTDHERGPPPRALTGNSPPQDVFIFMFAIINLIAGLVGWHLLGAQHEAATSWRWAWSVAKVAGGVLPVAFSLLLIGLMLLRTPFLVWVRARARRVVARTDVLERLLLHSRKRQRPLLLDGPYERRIALELEGMFDLEDHEGTPRTVWKFPRLVAELKRK